MNYNNIRNCNQRQFDAVMKRECIAVTDYYDSGKSYNVFFRRNNKGTTPQGKLRFYYAQDTSIAIGTIFTLKGIHYLVTSQDANESDVYHTSIAVRCDTALNVPVNTGGVVTVPCVTIKNEYTLSQSSSVNLVDGSITVYTGDNPYTRNIAINDGYYNFGGYYKVANTVYNDGLAYVYMTKEATPQSDNFLLTYNGVTSVDMAESSTYQLSYTATKNGTVVESPTLSYISNNDGVATVDSNGLLSFISTGTVSITATWTDGGNATCTTTFTVTNSGDIPPATVGTVTISGRTDLMNTYSRTYTATYTDVDGNDVSSNYNSVWSVEADFDTSNLVLDTSTQNKVTISVDNEDLVNSSFTLKVVDREGLYTPAVLEITIVG